MSYGVLPQLRSVAESMMGPSLCSFSRFLKTHFKKIKKGLGKKSSALS